MQTRLFQLLDVGLALESDSEELLSLFTTDYGWFGAKCLTRPKNLFISAILRDPRKPPFLKINDDILPLKDHPNPWKRSYRAVLTRILAEVEEFLVFHAAVVARNGDALIIAGLPGSGKSTLVMELLNRGFTYYSDDFCPVHRETGLVHPFPRALWREQPAGEWSPGNGHDLRGKKAPLSVWSLETPPGDLPCKAKMLVCLGAGSDSQPCRELEIGLKAGVGDAVIEELQALSGVVAVRTADRPANWHVSIPKGRGLTAKVREILRTHAPSIWNVYRVDGVAGDFEKDPVLSSMQGHKAALRLIQDLKHDPLSPWDSSVRTDMPGAFFARINRFLGNTRCFELSPGRLGAMGERVMQAWEGRTQAWAGLW